MSVAVDSSAMVAFPDAKRAVRTAISFEENRGVVIVVTQ
jgi:hypothetical protein